MPITTEKKIMNQKYASSLNFLFRPLSSIGFEKNRTKYTENPKTGPKSTFLTKNNVSGIIWYNNNTGKRKIKDPLSGPISAKITATDRTISSRSTPKSRRWGNKEGLAGRQGRTIAIP